VYPAASQAGFDEFRITQAEFALLFQVNQLPLQASGVAAFWFLQ